MSKYELSIEILDKDYIDTLIVSLVRQGYSVYYNETEQVVCCTITDGELTKLDKE